MLRVLAPYQNGTVQSLSKVRLQIPIFRGLAMGRRAGELQPLLHDRQKSTLIKAKLPPNHNSRICHHAISAVIHNNYRQDSTKQLRHPKSLPTLRHTKPVQ